MKQYVDLLQKILIDGKDRTDRTGTGTRGIFGYQMRFDLGDGFPLLTTKKLNTKSIVHELLWFLRGSTNAKELQNENVKIWDEWATKEECLKYNRPEGELGPIYGHQWRNFGASLLPNGLYDNDGVDQLKNIITQLENNKNSRRLVVTGWNPKEVNAVTLPPCHTLFQFHVQDNKLSCQLYQRSADVFLGVPFNIASYSLLTSMIAHVTNMEVGDFIITFGDAHLYLNHIEQAQLQLTRDTKKLPTLSLNKDIKNLFDFKFEDISIENYDAHPHIKAKVSI